MQAYVQPLDRLREALRWFMAVRELLLLHVTTGQELRIAALNHIAEAQHDAGASAAVLLSTMPAENSREDWTARVEELGESFTLIAEEAAKAEPPRALTPPRLGPQIGLNGFITALAEFARALEPVFASVVLTLAPQGITEADAWLRDLRQLVSDQRLSKVRFILVEPEPAPALALAKELGGLGDSVDIRVDPSANQKMLRAMVAGMRTAPAGADGYRMAGMAGPREAPPPRRGAPEGLSPEARAELEKSGASPGLAQPEALQALRVEALSASLAQSEGRAADAVSFQLKAHDIAERAGLTREATLMQLMLGGYLVQAGGAAQALDVFRKSAARAKELNQPDLEAQAHMATGGSLLAAGRPFDAAESYAAGARTAEAQGSKSLAIECYRMVGQILFTQGREAEAASAWQRAIAVAEGAPTQERAMSSAPLAGKALAEVYRRHGLHVQAEALEQQIAAWQASAAPVPSTIPPDDAPPTDASGGSP